MNRPMLLVLSAAGREGAMLRTVADLQERGGADTFPGDKVVYYIGLGNPPELRAGWRVQHVPGFPSGTTLDTFGALVFASNFHPSRLLFFEDDVTPVRGAVKVMHEIAVPDRCAFLTACDLRGYGGLAPAILEVPGAALDGRGHWGNQALVIPAGDLEGIVSRWPGGVTKNASDVVLGRAATSGEGGPRHYGVLTPSLVQHTGARSLATPGAGLLAANRTAPNWPGPGFDAVEAFAKGYQVGRTVGR